MSKVLIVIWADLSSKFYEWNHMARCQRDIREALTGFYGIQEAHLFFEFKQKDIPSPSVRLNVHYVGDTHTAEGSMRERSDAKILEMARGAFGDNVTIHHPFPDAVPPASLPGERLDPVPLEELSMIAVPRKKGGDSLWKES